MKCDKCETTATETSSCKCGAILATKLNVDDYTDYTYHCYGTYNSCDVDPGDCDE
jgi:hypothetical protein